MTSIPRVFDAHWFRVGLRERYSASRKCWVMVGTDRWRTVLQISWVLNLELDRNLLTSSSSSKHQSSRGVKIFWRWPRRLWLWDPVCHTRFKILLMAPWVTYVIRAILSYAHHHPAFYCWSISFSQAWRVDGRDWCLCAGNRRYCRSVCDCMAGF